MTCPKCGAPREPSWTECPRCGLIYAKYAARPACRPPRADAVIEDSSVKGFLLDFRNRPGTAGIYGRAVLLALLFVWSWWFILSPVESGYAGRSFMHLVNLPFHEAGHVFFQVFGSRLLTSLGGSLMQLSIPALCSGVLLLKTRDPFGASVALWWLGNNFIDLAPYIGDARSMSLPLLGGNTGATAPYGFHDWNFILTETHLLEHDQLLADLSHAFGSLVILASLAWGAASLLAAKKRPPGSLQSIARNV